MYYTNFLFLVLIKLELISLFLHFHVWSLEVRLIGHFLFYQSQTRKTQVLAIKAVQIQDKEKELNK